MLPKVAKNLIYKRKLLMVKELLLVQEKQKKQIKTPILEFFIWLKYKQDMHLTHSVINL